MVSSVLVGMAARAIVSFAVGWGSAAFSVPGRTADDQAEYEAKDRKACIEAAERHIELGVWCRDAGLVTQAGVEFVRAAEVGKRHHPRAQRILSIMDSLDERFWRKVRKKPSDSLLDTYEKRNRKARESDAKARLELATWCDRQEREDDAAAEYEALLRDGDGHLVLDSKGRIELEFGTVPEKYSSRILETAVRINGELYLRDEVLALIPQISGVFQFQGDRLRVRSMRSQEEAQAILPLGEALFRELTGDLGARSDRMLSVMVLDTRALYEQVLDALHLSGHKAATGVAISSLRMAVICGGELDAVGLQGVVLHELTHLYEMEVSRATMPSWYAEGLAEQYGGSETFLWDGKKLETGRPLREFERAMIRSEEGYLPLSEVLAGNALALLTNDRERATRFYAESWALVHYLRHAAPDDLQDLFATWEAMCRGRSLGAKPGDRTSHDPAAATNLWIQLFTERGDELEAGFREWLGLERS